MKKLLKKYWEIIMYLVFGVLTTVVSWGSYTLLVGVCGMPVFWGNLLSWVFAVAFAYVTNKLWVFDSKSWAPAVVAKELVGFVSSRGITGVLEIVCVPLLVKTGFDTLLYSLFHQLGLQWKLLYTDGIYSKILVSVIVVLLNYVFSKLIVFKKNHKDDEAHGE